MVSSRCVLSTPYAGTFAECNKVPPPSPLPLEWDVSSRLRVSRAPSDGLGTTMTGQLGTHMHGSVAL
jgi:hypothetical protein